MWIHIEIIDICGTELFKMKAIIVIVLVVFMVPTGDASTTKVKHLDKVDILKEILVRFFFGKGKVSCVYIPMIVLQQQQTDSYTQASHLIEV